MKAHASFNRFYRLLWSGTTEQWKPVPETARTAKKGGRGKAANTLTLAGVFPGVAMSLFVMSNLAAQPPPQPPAPAATQLPTGGAVVGGQATISQSAIATAANMVVNQSSQRAIIDWSSFNLGSAATVQFVQPNAQSVILNRVLDPNPSQIFGRINANGQVFLTNPYGVYFSPTATVDVGGLVATTYDIRNADFMSGYYKFERVGGSGRIVNEGALRATAGGYIALLAPEVQNSGVVLARAGTVAMAAGDEVTLTIADGKSLSGITTTASAIASLIENKLAVQAPDGQIILSAVAVNKLQAGVMKNLSLIHI
jgi:filamentous hemagglutinin family protein